MTKRWMLALATTAAMAAAALPGVCDGARAAPAAVTAADAFDKLKSLAGNWEGKAGDGKGSHPAGVQYRVTGNGGAVVETLMPGTPHEMVSVYHRDGDDLVMTHYCAAGNQPRMKLDRAASKPGELHFAFTGGSNLDPAKGLHMHEVRLLLLGDRQIESDWTAYNDGKPDHTAVFQLNRAAQ